MQARGAVEQDLVIAGRRIRLVFAGPAVVDDVLPAFRARLAPPAEPDVTLRVFDSASTGVLPPKFPWLATDVGERGAIKGWDGDQIGIAFHGDLMDLDHDFRAVSIYDHAAGDGVFWMLDRARTPWWERSAPLRSLIHWALRSPERLLVHGATVGHAGTGVLLAGPGGSGKSTTAVAAVLNGFDYVGDDYCLVDVTSLPTSHNVFGTAKLKPDTLSRWPELGRTVLIATPQDTGEKAVLDVAAELPDQVVEQLTLTGLVVPRVGTETRLTRISKAEALQALAPTTVLQLPPDGGRALRPLARLAGLLPCWGLELGGDYLAALDLLRSLEGVSV